LSSEQRYVCALFRRLAVEEIMVVRSVFLLAIVMALTLTLLRGGYPLPGAAGQEPPAGAPDVIPPAPFANGLPRHMRAARECGLNSLYLLLRLCGHDVTFEQTREAVPIGPSGTSLLELQQAASRLGARTTMSRCSMAELVQVPKPVIAHLHPEMPDSQADAGHFVVVVRADKDGVEAIDSTFAASFHYSVAHFESVWSGHILAPAPPQTWARPLALTVVVGIWLGMGLACWWGRVSRRVKVAPAALAPAEGART
jgi:hypothetical protein